MSLKELKKLVIALCLLPRGRVFMQRIIPSLGRCTIFMCSPFFPAVVKRNQIQTHSRVVLATYTGLTSFETIFNSHLRRWRLTFTPRRSSLLDLCASVPIVDHHSFPAPFPPCFTWSAIFYASWRSYIWRLSVSVVLFLS